MIRLVSIRTAGIQSHTLLIISPLHRPFEPLDAIVYVLIYKVKRSIETVRLQAEYLVLRNNVFLLVTHLPTYLPTYLPTCLPTYPPTYMPTDLHTHLPTC